MGACHYAARDPLMVGPYPALLLLLGVGFAVLQLPVLPTPTFVQLAALVLLIVLLIALLLCLLWRSTKTPASTARESLVLLVIPAVIVILGTFHVLIPAAYWQERLLPIHCERQRVRVDGVIDGLIHRFDSAAGARVRLDVRVLSLSPERCAGPRQLRVYLDEDMISSPVQVNVVNRSPIKSMDKLGEISSGSRLIFDARLRRPWGLVNPAATEGEKAFLVANIHAIGSVSEVHERSNPSGLSLGFSARLYRIRDALSHDIQTRIPGEVGALLAALAVGDRRAMTPDVWARLRLYGLTHLLVISGMHITLLALPGWWFGSGLSRVFALLSCEGIHLRFLPPLFAMLGAGAYGLLSGFALPAQRALLMLVLVLLPGLCGRSLHSGRVLPLAGIGLYALNPVSILAPSFWLTLGAVALLLWFTAWRNAGGGLRKAWAAQGFMLVAMLPLSLFWFQEASSIGGVINLVAIPLVTLAVVPLLLISLVWAPMLASAADLHLNAAATLLSLLWSALGYWEPFLAQWSVLRASIDLLVFIPALMAIFLMPLPRFVPKKVIVSLLLAPLLMPSQKGGSNMVELVFFDVGQGTAVLLRHGDKTLLYDTGGGSPGGPATAARSLIPMFRSRGIDALQTLVISHPDQDHSGGEALVSEVAAPTRVRRGIADEEAEKCRLGEVERFGDAVILRYLSQGLPGDSDNNASCVLLLSAYGNNILLAGDIDARRERDLLAYWGSELKVDILMATHHGSASSNSRLWLRSLAPAVMVVTAGHSNRFGHPAARVIDTAAAQGVRVLNTATHGAVIFRLLADGSVQCEASRNRWQPFWRRGASDRDCQPPHSVIRGYNQRDN
ncbi:DNA internalization-related competence protein ComEC/Rec2 [Congregibacter sp.]|uniref:DNA internalization-related competence protein ComEC/Rec2 n=1 Tax=Congregibacter sp. TaxID=2744308 RepID=UPI0039E6254B